MKEKIYVHTIVYFCTITTYVTMIVIVVILSLSFLIIISNFSAYFGNAFQMAS